MFIYFSLMGKLTMDLFEDTGIKRDGKGREIMSLKHFPAYMCICVEARDGGYIVRGNTKVSAIRVKYKVTIRLGNN